MIHIAIYILMLLFCLGAVALNIISLPGNWLMMVVAVLWSWYLGWNAPSLLVLFFMLIVLLVAEAIELVGGLVGAQKFGASKSASWAAIPGAMIGAIVGAPAWMLGPFGFLGNLVGAVLGAFIAAWIVELLKKRPLGLATRGAIGAALGRGMGIATKIGCGVLVWLALAFFGFPL